MSRSPLSATALIVGLALSAGLALPGCGAAPKQMPGVPPPIAGPDGRPAETVDFALPDAAGQVVALSDMRGRVVLVTFFTTWCDPCIAEIPQLNALMDPATGVEGLEVVGISLDLNPRAFVAEFAQLMGIKYTVLFADEAMLQGVTPFGPVRAIPAAFLVDRQGRHVESFQGLTPIEHIRRKAQALAQESR